MPAFFSESASPTTGKASDSQSDIAENIHPIGDVVGLNGIRSFKSGGGCPFAALAKAGVPLPNSHPAMRAASSRDQDESKCPLQKFKTLDVAIVLVLVAIMLLILPSNHQLRP